MKKIIYYIILFVVITINLNVYAKDTIYSFNKYSDEKMKFIENSYNKEGKIDGQIVGGEILKKTFEENDTTYNDYQAIIIKYNNSGDVIWKYIYGDNKEDYLYGLSYTYDASGKVDGYLMVTEKTCNIASEGVDKHNSIFLKIDLEGKLVWQKETNINKNEIANKIIPIKNKDNIIEGYILAANTVEDKKYKSGILSRFDRDLNLLWQTEYIDSNYDEISFKDLTLVNSNNELVGYSVIRELTTFTSNKKVELVKYDLSGNEVKVLTDSLDKYISYNLSMANDGFILYGLTKEVKLKKGNNSYYIINYNSKDEDYWETIGDVSVDSDKKVIIHPLEKNNTIKEYLLLYSNTSNNTEVVRIDTEGTILEKIKKIFSEYYDIENLNFKNNILFLVGQINCPKDDTCEYDSNSLFLISEEDKVIEVKDNTGRNILLGITAFIILIIGIVLYNRKRKS